MTLREWMTKHGLSYRKAAARLPSVGSAQRLGTILRGTSAPTLTTIDHIHAETGGEVTRTDWPWYGPEVRGRK